MQIKHVKNDPQSMAQDGGKILKSLQNETMPLIDIIVRESIQNSLDANNGDKVTEIDFIVDSFDSHLLAGNLAEIDELINKRFSREQKFLAIRDVNTTGLTGAYKSNSLEELNRSNFHKLVFSIGKNQEQEGAGGSWGYGKTSFFRLGIGLIFYYTRIKVENGYEERLIASMIEDPKKSFRFLTNNERGIAWWGELSEDGELVYPIVNPREISDFMEVFPIKRYKGNETGTTIIIPYLPEKEQMSIDTNILISPWEYSYEDEIGISIKRWYFPRILNTFYSKIMKNSMLLPKVNGESIHPYTNFEPIFKYFQELYNAGLSGKSSNESIIIRDIKFRATAKVDDLIGRIAFMEVSKKDLQMYPPYNKPSAFAFIGEKDKTINENFNSTIVAYSRRPGMVVEYSIDGKWAPTNINKKDDHILIAFFVPNSSVQLSKDFQKEGYNSLENYLRSIETSDHAVWEDKVGITIVKRIKSYTLKAIADTYKELDTIEELGQTSALSRKFGSFLMPPKNFGSISRNPRIGKINHEKGKSFSKSGLTVLNTEFINDNQITVRVNLNVKKKSQNIIYIYLNTQDRNMDELEWNRQFTNNSPFPFNLENIYIITNSKRKYLTTIEEYNKVMENTTVVLDKTITSQFRVYNDNNSNVELKLKLTCNILQKDFMPSIGIKSVKDELNEQ